MTIHRSLTATLAAIALGALMAACGSSSESSSSSNSPSAMTKVTFVADYNPAWPAQVPWNVALEKGWYKQAGLDVSYQLPPSNSDPPRIVGAGRADMTVSYSPDLLAAKSKGLDVKALASLLDQNVEGIMTYDPSIQQPKDLEGKTVAIYDFPMAQINWKTFTDHYRIDRSKVEVVPEGAYGVPLIVAKKADAIDGAAGGELDDANSKLKKDAKFFVYQSSNGIPNFYWFVLAGNGKWVQSHPEAAKKFVAVTLRGLKYATEHPDEAADIFAKRNPKATSPELARRSWKSVIAVGNKPYMPSKPAGYMDPTIWQNYATFLKGQKFLTSPVDANQLLTANKYLP